MPQLRKILKIDAKGGPDEEVLGDDGHSQTSTRPGRFIIYALEKHVSPERYAKWSGIPWGTPMRLNKDTAEIKLRGIWQALTTLKKWKKYADNQAHVKKEIVDYYKDLGYKNIFPDKWVFNDFGHITVKYFRDLNGDRIMNKGKERPMSDFIHTTPPDEASAALGDDVWLDKSHGCIHLKPADIDTLIAKGYLKRGNTVEVHPYTVKTIPLALSRKDAKPFYEFHVFPGIYKAAVYKVVK